MQHEPPFAFLGNNLTTHALIVLTMTVGAIGILQAFRYLSGKEDAKAPPARKA